MKNKILNISLVLLFIFIFLIFYRGLNNTNIYTPSKIIDKNIPTFSTTLLNSNIEISSEEIFVDERYYLMNIWASWCVPCRDEHPILLNLSRNYNIEIIGLNYKDKKENANLFLKKLGNPYKKILLDENGTEAIKWGAYGVPESFLIYKNRIIKKFIGPINLELFNDIKKIIK
jgi:cytochrome c biogenesis protein CcmG, thiol:disulfide interchange protein DsbE